ncbi:MAG: YitT family protein [Flavobacteriales bacterium]|nr:YitT family protein [Flavobacteriales bacterium]
MRGTLRHRLIRLLPETGTARKGGKTPYVHAKALLNARINLVHGLKDALFIAIGVCSAAFGLEGFLLPNGFLDGGATGIALLASRLTGMSFSALLVVINLPFIFLAYRLVGRAFALRAGISIVALATLTSLVHIQDVTHDKLLVAAFGGFFLGAGIGLAVRGGSVLDGTEVLALSLGRKIGITIGDVIMLINVAVFSVAAWLIDLETAMYAMITYLAASKTLDLVVEGIEEYTGITITSPHHAEIRHMIANTMGRGITVYSGKRGFTKGAGSHEVDILYCVLTRLEVGRFLAEIEKIDPNAFVVMSPVKDVRGGIMRKRRAH